jgi:hypothetical protein
VSEYSRYGLLNPERECECGHSSTHWFRCICNRVVCIDCFRSTKSVMSSDGREVVELGDVYCLKCRPPKPTPIVPKPKIRPKTKR